jgi:hypothetical protein
MGKIYTDSHGTYYTETKGDPWRRGNEEYRNVMEQDSFKSNEEPLAYYGEEDPNGIDQHDPGAKLDQGKPRVAMVLRGFANAIYEVAKVGTFGARKYTDYGFLSVPDGQARYDDAEMRHKLKVWMGKVTDPDSQLLHLSHAAWNALAQLEFYMREKDGKNEGSAS